MRVPVNAVNMIPVELHSALSLSFSHRQNVSAIRFSFSRIHETRRISTSKEIRATTMQRVENRRAKGRIRLLTILRISGFVATARLQKSSKPKEEMSTFGKHQIYTPIKGRWILQFSIYRDIVHTEVNCKIKLKDSNSNVQNSTNNQRTKEYFFVSLLQM